MKIQGSVALVTGANRGLGTAFARELTDVPLLAPGRSGGYSAFKASGWALSNALRQAIAALAAEAPVYVGTGA
jgi:hypothetical protein